MADIVFTDEDRSALAGMLRAHCAAEFDLELGGLEADALLDWIAERMGPAFYNQGVLDARATMESRLAEATEALEGLIRGTDGRAR